MIPYYKSYLDQLEEVHNELAQAIDGLPQAALDWIPSEGMNSINVIVTHLTGAERYWIGDVAASNPFPRKRAEEFLVSGITPSALRQRLDDFLAFARHTLETFTLQDLEQVRKSPRDGREFTVAWALLHALEHAALHMGHVQLTRQLWEKHKG